MLGISISDITPEMARRLDLGGRTEGVYVGQVNPNGAAEKAGIKAGDIIVEFNLNKLANSAALQEQVNRLRPGEQAVVTVLRAGSQKEIIVSF